MRTTKGLSTCFICLCFVAIPTLDVFCQQQGGMAEAEEEGKFEITLRSQPQKTIRVDSLILDRDQDKRLGDLGRDEQSERRYYRVEHQIESDSEGKKKRNQVGYLGFKEAEWVDKLSFKAFNKPMTEMPLYKEYAELLSAITATIFQFKQTLGTYDQYGLRLIQICDESRFKSPQNIDNRVRDQLSAYSSLEKLREDVLGSLTVFTETSACKDLVRDYEKSLNQSLQELSELSKKYRAIENKVNQMHKEASEADQRSRGRTNTGNQFDKTPLKY